MMKYSQNRISGVFLTEFYLKLKVVAASGSGPGVLDGEYPAGHSEIALLHFTRPVVKDLLYAHKTHFSSDMGSFADPLHVDTAPDPFRGNTNPDPT